VAPLVRGVSFLPLVALLFAATPAAPARAAEDATRARLIYTVDPAAAPCPSAGEFRAAVEARVGHAVFGEPATLTIAVELRRDGKAYVATVALPDVPGERGTRRELLSDVGCAELATAAALVASIAADPASALRPAPAPPAPPVAAAPRIWRAYAGAGARGLAGVTPEPTVGLALSGAAVSEHASYGAALEGYASGDASLAPGSVSIRPVSLALLPCRLGPHWELCGVARLGLVRGSGEGYLQNLATWKAFAGLGGRGAAFVDVGRLRLRASLEASAVLPRTAFVVGETTAYTTRGVSLVLGLDALLAFP
jgi:hypothetical protein